MQTTPVNVRELLDGHITLQLESLDRIYLNGYVPKLHFEEDSKHPRDKHPSFA